MNCATSTIKFLVFISNALCAIFGLFTVVLCIVALNSFTHSDQTNLLKYGIAIGCIIFMISFFGCCGAHRESTCFMWMYLISIGILIIMQLCLIVSLYKGNLTNIVTKHLEELWAQEVKEPGSMADIETSLQCCGLHDSNDYKNANMTIPASCYNDNKVIFQEGCLQKAIGATNHAIKVAKTCSWVMTAIQGTAFVLAGILIYSFRNSHRAAYQPY